MKKGQKAWVTNSEHAQVYIFTSYGPTALTDCDEYTTLSLLCHTESKDVRIQTNLKKGTQLWNPFSEPDKHIRHAHLHVIGIMRSKFHSDDFKTVGRV